jgi:hypothetical protein
MKRQGISKNILIIIEEDDFNEIMYSYTFIKSLSNRLYMNIDIEENDE